MAPPASTSDPGAAEPGVASGQRVAEAGAPRGRESLAWLTWLRVVAMLGVICIHASGSTAAQEGARQLVDGQVAIALDLGFVWAVPVFVMMSGTLLLDPRRFRDSATFLRKRVARLVPPLVFWTLVYLTYMVLTRPGWSHGPVDLLGRVLTGGVAPHLYFLYVVLGLAVITPVLVRWLAATGRREWVVGGLLAWCVPLLGTLPLSSTGSALGFTHNAWTWWLPYAGFFVLGWALRDVLLPRRGQLVAAVAALALMAEVIWQWRNDAAPDWLQDWAKVSYYSLPVGLLSVLVFVFAQSAIRPGGLLGGLTSPGVMRWVEPIGAATMGIFGLHFLVIVIGNDHEWFGPAATTWPLLLARIATVAVLTTAVVLLLRRVPVVNRVL